VKKQFLYLALLAFSLSSKLFSLHTETKIAQEVGHDTKAAASAAETKVAVEAKAEAVAELPAELKQKIDALITNHLVDKNMPLSCMICHSQENLKIVVEGAVEAALKHFPDKKSLQTFTGYASGELALEYLILKALALAGFNQIKVINMVDIQYPLGFYAANSEEFHPLQPSPKTPAKEKLGQIAFFRKQFMSARLNLFYSIYNHTFACLDDTNNALKTRSDLIFMSNYQTTAIAPATEYSLHTQEYRKQHKDLVGQAFDYISLANAHRDALVVETAFSGAGHDELITYTVPVPPHIVAQFILDFSLRANRSFDYLTQVKAPKPQQAHINPDVFESLQEFNKYQEKISKRAKEHPQLFSYFEKMTNKFQRIKQQLKDWGIDPDTKS